MNKREGERGGELPRSLADLYAMQEVSGRSAPRRAARGSRLKAVVVSSLVLALGVSSLAVAQDAADGGAEGPAASVAQIDEGDALRAEVRNGTTGKETEVIGKFNATPDAPKGGYVTRQSNTQTGANAGGGAIYGCRGAPGGTAAGSAPCIRANNVANGYAFEFSGGSGNLAGLITVGNPTERNNDAAPFATNATAVAQGLNADRVDGKSADDFLADDGKAADADKLDGKDSDEFLPSSTHVAYNSRLAVGEEKVIATDGAISVVHQCVDQGGGSTESRLIARTTQDGAFLVGNDNRTGAGGTGTKLDTATPANDAEITDVSSTGELVQNDTHEGVVLGPNGTDNLALSTSATGLGVNATGVDCLAFGHVMTA